MDTLQQYFLQEQPQPDWRGGCTAPTFYCGGQGSTCFSGQAVNDLLESTSSQLSPIMLNISDGILYLF